MAGDLKHRRPIPHYLDDRKLLVSRHLRGPHMHDDPPALERLQGEGFISPSGTVTDKGSAAVEEIKRLAEQFGRPTSRFPVNG